MCWNDAPTWWGWGGWFLTSLVNMYFGGVCAQLLSTHSRGINVHPLLMPKSGYRQGFTYDNCSSNCKQLQNGTLNYEKKLFSVGTSHEYISTDMRSYPYLYNIPIQSHIDTENQTSILRICMNISVYSLSCIYIRMNTSLQKQRIQIG